MDKRFRGNWAKKTNEAKFWGFFMGNTGSHTHRSHSIYKHTSTVMHEYTHVHACMVLSNLHMLTWRAGILWFCFCFVLVKKIVSPLILNWTNGAFNAIAITTLFWLDGFANFITMSHRDNMINYSHLWIAVGNGMAALVTTLHIVLPEELIPEWVNGPVVMFCMLGATAVSGITAMLEPLSQVFSVVTKLDVLACMAPLVPILKGASGFLFTRIERILQMRSKKKAQEEMFKEKQAAEHGDRDHPIVFRTCVICDEQFDEDQGIICCGVPRLAAPPTAEHHGDKHKHFGLHFHGSAHLLNDDGGQESEEAQPPHFTCSSCLTGHIMNMIEENGHWHTHHAIPCSVSRVNCDTVAATTCIQTSAAS